MRIAAFEKLAPAQALLADLEKHGLRGRIHDEQNLQRFWFLTRPHANISVEVHEEIFAAAQGYLDTYPDRETLLRGAIRCPSCHSPRVDYPQMTRKNIIPTLVGQMLMAVRLIEPEYYCENCHYTWAAASPNGRPSDPPR